jgi:3-phenylpropionate/cinnamic acid dioxygenase small subunit
MVPVAHVERYRGFVFCKLSDAGPDFASYFGASLTSIDNLADRSPQGELEITGGCLRFLHACNWKMFVENLNDTMHPMVVHESSAGTAKTMWKNEPADKPRPMAIEQFVPFVSDYKFYEDMGVRVFANGHSYSGVHFSIHSGYSGVAGYEEAMHAAYGPERSAGIMKVARHNTVYYPSLTIKGAIQSIRVVRPIAVDKTVIESWTFRLKGAPEALLARTVTYNRLINSPFSVVGHDDLHAYRAIQKGLQASGNPWVSLLRDFDPAEIGQAEVTGDRHERSLDAQPVPRLGAVHDRDDASDMSAVEPSERELIDFVVREARLLDDKRYEEWLDLWTDDGIYWVPLTPEQSEGIHHNSHLYEDKLLRTLRVERLKSPRAYSQQPPSRALHVLQAPTLESSDASAQRFVLRTPFHYSEAQGDEIQSFVGTAFHHLVRDGSALRLRLKRVDLLNGEAALPAVQLFI